MKSLTFFHNDNAMENILLYCIEQNEKAMFFIQSAKKAYKLFAKYKEHSLFNCSRSNKQHYKYVDGDKITNMLHNEKFDEQFLITTACFDAGANIIDENVKHIIVDITDVSSLTQCIGRRRIVGDEKIDIYIKSINNQQLGGIISTTKKKIEMAEYLNTHTLTEFVEAYPREIDFSNIIYDDTSNSSDENTCEKKVNRLMLQKKKNDIKLFTVMTTHYPSKDCGKEFGYCKYLAQKFGFFDADMGRYEYDTIVGDNPLTAILKSMVGKPMLKVSDRKAVINAIDARSDSKQLKSLKTLNDVLEERNIAFRIIEKSLSAMVDGKQKRYPAAWIIQTLESIEKDTLEINEDFKPPRKKREKKESTSPTTDEMKIAGTKVKGKDISNWLDLDDAM